MPDSKAFPKMDPVACFDNVKNRMRKSYTFCFERRSYRLSELVNSLDEGGIIWGRDYGVVSIHQPDHFELSFQDEDLASQAVLLWAAKVEADEMAAAPNLEV